MIAPEITVLLSDGRRLALRDLYAKDTLVLVFLRHYGCAFARDQIRRMSEAKCRNVVYVGMADPQYTEKFRKDLSIDANIICDPERELYRAFGLGSGTLGQLLGPRVVLNATALMLKGRVMRRPIGDPKQMPGVFIIDQTGSIRWASKAGHAAEMVSSADIDAVFERLTTNSNIL